MSMTLKDVGFDVGGGDAVAGEDEQTLDYVAELSDVSGPGLLDKKLHGIGIDFTLRHSGLRAYLSDEIVHKKRDIGLALIQ